MYWGKDGLKAAKKYQLYQQNMVVSLRTKGENFPSLCLLCFLHWLPCNNSYLLESLYLPIIIFWPASNELFTKTSLSSYRLLLLIVSLCTQQVLGKDLLNGIEYNFASNVSS